MVYIQVMIQCQYTAGTLATWIADVVCRAEPGVDDDGDRPEKVGYEDADLGWATRSARDVYEHPWETETETPAEAEAEAQAQADRAVT